MSLKNLQADGRERRRSDQVGHPHQRARRRRPTRLFIGFVALALMTMLGSVACVVVYKVRFIESKTGRTDYAVAGESIELSCHYLMKDDIEEIKSIIWSKDGMNFARWSKYKPGVEVLDYTFKGHIDNSTTHSHLIIHNVTIDMHGRYSCYVRTDLGHHNTDYDLTVVTRQACKLDDWRIKSQHMECSETFRFDCRHMFPKPKLSCGLWNSRTEKFIESVPIDITEDVPLLATSKPTYRVQYINKFELAEPDGSPNRRYGELLRYAGHLVFKCDIFVADTSWKLSIRHKMFDFADGCEQDPLEAIRKMRITYNQYVRQRLQQGPLNQSVEEHQKQHQHSQHLQTVDDGHPVASSFDMEVLLPSQVRKLMRQNKYGGPGEVDLDPKSNFGAEPSSKPRPSYITEDMNCWKKPRIGTIIKLSCPDAGRKGIKLMGSNLLECRANGWNLVRENHLINKEILDKKTYKARMSRGKLASHLWPTSYPMTKPTTAMTITPVSSIETASTSDDDYDNSAVAAHTTRLFTTETEDVTIPILASTSATISPPPEDEEDDDDDFAFGILETKSKPKTELGPERLVDLLPSCVMVSQKRRKDYAHKSSSGAGLTHLETGAVTDERHFRMTNGVGHSSHPPNSNPPDWKWYSIVNSASSDYLPLATSGNIGNQAFAAVIVYCVILMVSTLFQPDIRFMIAD